MELTRDDKIYLGQKEARFHSKLDDIDAVVSITHTAYMATGEFGDYEEVEEFDKLVVVPLSDISLKPLYDTDILSMRNLEIEKAKTEARRIVNEAKKERSTELTNHQKELKNIQEKISNLKIVFNGMAEAKEIASNEFFLTGHGVNNDYYTLITKENILKEDTWSIKISINGSEKDITFYPVSYEDDYMYMSKYGRKGLAFKTKQETAEFLNKNIKNQSQYSLERIEKFEDIGISLDIFKERKEKLKLIADKHIERNKIQDDINLLQERG